MTPRTTTSRRAGWLAATAALALLTLPPGAALAAGAPAAAPPRPALCTASAMVEDLRASLRDGSPALQRYLRAQLKEAALALPADELVRAMQRERDPGVLEALGAALGAKASYAENPTLLQPLLARASQDPDPLLRAAAVRSLRATGSVESMEKNGQVVTYEQLIRDPAPQVREAVVENLIAEDREVYGGHDRTVAETAIAAARASSDPKAAARLLSQVSMEQVGPEAVGQLQGGLRSEDAQLRAAHALALGGVPGASAASAEGALLAQYRSEQDDGVRKAILQSLVRLRQAGALPVLESLRGIAPSMNPEIDAWRQALGSRLQEWHLLLREKQRLRP